MKFKVIKFLSAACLLVSSMAAQAGLIFSNLSFTETSFTFTVDGDLSGYDLAGTHNGVTDFSIIYRGDIWNVANSGTSALNWTGEIFDANPVVEGGTGSWSGSTHLYTWINTSSILDNTMTATNNTFTITLDTNLFNANITAGQVDFIAGWGNSTNVQWRTELLGSVDVGVPRTSVPEPSTLAIFGTMLLALTRLKKRA